MACFGISSVVTLDYSSTLNYVVSLYTVQRLSILSEGTTGKK